MALIFSTHQLHPEVTETLRAAGEYRVASSPTAAAFLAEGTGAEVIVVRAPLPAEYFARAPGLRAAVRHGAGLDMIPMEAATAAGVLVANVPGVNASTVAEYAIFTAIALMRRFREIDARLRGAPGWASARELADVSRDLGGRTLGIVGFGNIGQALNRLAAGLRDARHQHHPPPRDVARRGHGPAARRTSRAGGRGRALLPADGRDARPAERARALPR